MCSFVTVLLEDLAKSVFKNNMPNLDIFQSEENTARTLKYLLLFILSLFPVSSAVTGVYRRVFLIQLRGKKRKPLTHLLMSTGDLEVLIS